MSRTWDKEKIILPDGNRTHGLPNTGRALYPLSYGETLGEQGHKLGSYVTRVMHTARIGSGDSVLCGDK